MHNVKEEVYKCVCVICGSQEVYFDWRAETVVDSWACRWSACWGLKITHIHTLQPHASCAGIHLCMLTDVCTLLKLNLLLFFAIKTSFFLSLCHVLTMTSPCGPPSFMSGMWFKFSLHLSLSPSLPIFLFITLPHIPNFPITVSLLLTDKLNHRTQHMGMNDLHVSSQRWYRLGHIAAVHILCAH